MAQQNQPKRDYGNKASLLAVGKSPARRESNDDFYVNTESMMGDQRVDSNESLEEASETMRQLHKVEEAHESLRTDNPETPKTMSKNRGKNSNTKNDKEDAWTPLD